MKWTTCVVTGLVFAGVLLGRSRAGEVVAGPQQVEADWLRQELLREHPTATGAKITPQQDARGGCDGVKTGQWGFHTANEPQPWWQVDLGQPTAIERVVLYNRCDGTGRAQRTDHDPRLRRRQDLPQVYQHDGTTFYGFTDKKPLSVALTAITGPLPAAAIAGQELFPSGRSGSLPRRRSRNVALGQPATQSSASQWSVDHLRRGRRSARARRHGARPSSAGLRLAEDLAAGGVSPWTTDVRRHCGTVEARGRPPAAARRTTCGGSCTSTPAGPCAGWPCAIRCWTSTRSCSSRRRRARFPHMSDQFYGWWSRPGGGVFLLDGFKSRAAAGRAA